MVVSDWLLGIMFVYNWLLEIMVAFDWLFGNNSTVWLEVGSNCTQ